MIHRFILSGLPINSTLRCVAAAIAMVVVNSETLSCDDKPTVKRLVVKDSTMDDGKVLKDVTIQVRSTRGYVIGSSFQQFQGIHVSPVKKAPDGYEFQRELILWSDLRSIEWTGDLTKTATAKVLFTSKARIKKVKSGDECHIWVPGEKAYHALLPSAMKIAGTMKIDGRDEDVEIVDGKFLKLEFAK